MRDLTILGLLVFTTLWALKAPWIGAMGWTLVSLMSPHVEFGYGTANLPVATGYALCTLIGLLLTRERQSPLIGAGPKWMLAFTIWTCITLPFSLIFGESLMLWERSMKIYLMAFVTVALLTNEHRLRVFIWINVIAIGYYCVKGGLFTIATGGNYRVWGPGGFIGGNNELALAAIATVPLMRFLQTQLKRRWAVHAMTLAMLLSVAMALGTHSRGALVGLACMGTYFWIKSDRKVLGAVLILLIVAVGLPMMPEHWWSRMDTIKTYDQDDSALGRINAWWMAFNMANDRIFGGGFMIYYPEIFLIYSPEPERVHAAHSIYFQVLGEHGWIGLALFMGIGVSTWLSARDLIRMGRRSPRHAWAAHLGAMVQVSMIGYGSAGAFLSLAYFDFPYNVMIIATLAQHFVRQQIAQDAKDAAAAAAPAVGATPPPVRLPQPRPALPTNRGSG